MPRVPGIEQRLNAACAQFMKAVLEMASKEGGRHSAVRLSILGGTAHL
jgi:hypothetical protein